MNQAIHTLDLLQWFVGPVTDVRGTVATLALPDVIEVEDTAALRLQHRTRGRPGRLRLLRDQRARREHPGDHRDRHRTRPHPAGHRPHRRARRRAGREHSDLPPWRRGGAVYWGASHGLLIDDFYRHVSARKRFSIDAPAALESLRVIQAAVRPTPAHAGQLILWTAAILAARMWHHRSTSGGTATMSEDPAETVQQIRRSVQPPRPFRPG